MDFSYKVLQDILFGLESKGSTLCLLSSGLWLNDRMVVVAILKNFRGAGLLLQLKINLLIYKMEPTHGQGSYT